MNEANQNNSNEQIQSVPTPPPVQEPIVTIQNEQNDINNNRKNDKKNKELVIFAILFIIVVVFIFLLPKTYKFISNFSFDDIKNLIGNNSSQTSEESGNSEKKSAIVCTGVDSDGIQSTHTLYFTNKTLSKVQLNETYTLDEDNTVDDLDKFYETIKTEYNSNKNIEISTTSDETSSTVTALITLEKDDTNSQSLMSVKVNYKESYDSVISKYNKKGYICE